MKPDWLPPLVLFEGYNGDWTHYLEAIYALFKANFVDSKPLFRGIRLGLKRYPLTYNKEATFWHFIQEGQFEAERTPDLRRCERIGWPRANFSRKFPPGFTYCSSHFQAKVSLGEK
jgi:hypothetical protein